MIAIRAISRKLLDWSVALAPENTREWAEAMRNESEYLEGGAELLEWSCGCFRTSVREFVLQAFSARLRTGGRGWSRGGEKELNMRKVILVASVMLVTLFGFMLAPSFRQAITVAGGPYVQIFSSTPNEVGPSASKLLALRDRAVANHDAKMLAAIALLMPQTHLRHWPPIATDTSSEGEQSIAIARQAVAMDPAYTFIYLQLAEANQASPQFPLLMDALHRWDPDNAVIWLAEAEHSLTGRWKGPNYTTNNVDLGPEWTANMEKAFRSPKYDTYYSQDYNLILWAAANDIVEQPMAITWAASRVSLGQSYDIRQYAHQLLNDDSASKAQKLANAREVGQFADVMMAGAGPWFEKTIAQGIAANALRTMSDALPGNELSDVQQRRNALKAQAGSIQPEPLSVMMASLESNAAAAQVSIFAMGLCLLVFFYIVVRAAIRQRVSAASTIALWIDAVVFFASCVTCYVAYRPFAAVLEYLERNPNPNNARLSFIFWSFADNPLIRLFSSPADRAVVGWTALIVLGALALAWLASREVTRVVNRKVTAGT